MSDKPVVVVAEDEPQIANLVRYKLEKSGYEVLWGKDGQRAWELIQESKPDLVILDVMMPIMDGFEVLRAMHDGPETREIPAIMVTARGMEEDILKGFEEGAVDYMVKPFSVTELAARVKATIGRREQDTE
jgi:DNA-binding response OmpR family regulator